MIQFPRILTAKAWAILGVIVVTLLVLLSWRGACSAIKMARADAQQAKAVGEALDTVAEQTPVIRQEQAEKQREVEKIEGADQRLPAGFGASLERVRRGNGSSDDPR
jgi:hypothetical protein